MQCIHLPTAEYLKIILRSSSRGELKMEGFFTKQTISGIALGIMISVLVYAGVVGISYLAQPKTEENPQATMPHILSIKQVKHMDVGAVAWIDNIQIYVDDKSKVWIMQEAITYDEKPTKISLNEKKGFCLEVPSSVKWKVGGQYRHHHVFPAMEIKIYNDK